MFRGDVWRALKWISWQVIILRPVHERDITSVGAFGKIFSIHDAAVLKQAGCFLWIETVIARLKRDGI